MGELSAAAQDTYVEGSRARPSLSKSEGSEIPLEPAGIRKKTEFWISEGPGQGEQQERPHSHAHSHADSPVPERGVSPAETYGQAR